MSAIQGFSMSMEMQSQVSVISWVSAIGGCYAGFHCKLTHTMGTVITLLAHAHQALVT